MRAAGEYKERLCRKIKDEINERIAGILTGGCDHEAYKYWTGYIKGLQVSQEFLDEIIREMMEE